LCPISTAASVLWVELLASKPLAKGVGVDVVGKTEDAPPLTPVENGLSAWTE
jgi:hypothetical protein